MNREQRCQTCGYWSRDYAGRKGDCRFRAPTRVQLTDPEGHQTYVGPGWPSTEPTDWCGDWRRDPNADAKVAQDQADKTKAQKEWRAWARADLDKRLRDIEQEPTR